MPSTSNTATPAFGRCWCPTRIYLSCPPADLIPWRQAAAVVARTPYPMSERTLRRKYLASGGRVYEIPRGRGKAQLVSRTAVYEWHRNYVNGWLPPPRS